MKIKFISDIICPWCYVGKRRLEQALSDLDIANKVEIEISPYELHPDTWPEGRSTQGYKDKGEALLVLKEAGQPLGIDFRFDRISKIPNTLIIHGYLMSVEGVERHQLKDAFLKAYFTQGQDLTDMLVVKTIIKDCLGRPLEDVSDLALEEVSATILKNRSLGVRAVPSFVINDEHIISGAIEADRWRQFFSKNIA